jgi:hypothetical protein
MKAPIFAIAFSAVLATTAFAQAPSGGTVNGAGDKTTGSSSSVGTANSEGKSVAGHRGAMSGSGNSGAGEQAVRKVPWAAVRAVLEENEKASQ